MVSFGSCSTGSKLVIKMFAYICFASIFVVACNAQIPNSQASAQAANRNAICQQRNAYYRVSDKCDAYVECREYQAKNEMCPDGLHFNPNVTWPEYPCGYPMEVACSAGSAQAAQATAECPHQFGFFKSPVADPKNCGQYRFCAAGIPTEMSCPLGLAFSPETGRCDWPDLVPSCNAAEFLGFSCPPAPVDADGLPLNIIINYKYEGNCYYFFSCTKGFARLLQCDEGLAFDSKTGRCIEEELVGCVKQPVATPY